MSPVVSGGAVSFMIDSQDNKQKFTNIDVNLYIPRDPNMIKTSFKMSDAIEDEPENFERL